MALASVFAAAIHCAVVLGVGSIPLTWKFEGKLFDALLAFGAGVLLSAAFLHMLPAAIPSLGAAAGFFVLLGYLVMLVLEQFVMAHPCGEEACPNHHLGLSALLGLSVHSVISGVALGVGLRESADASVSAALLAAILVHKVPETLALMGLLAASHWTSRASTLALVGFSLMGPAGILFGNFLSIDSPALLGAALAISSGTFLYIASADLLPQLHKKMKQQWVHFFAFLLGLGLLAVEGVHHLGSH